MEGRIEQNMDGNIEQTAEKETESVHLLTQRQERQFQWNLHPIVSRSAQLLIQ